MSVHCISYASGPFLPRLETFSLEIENSKYFDSYKIYQKQDIETNLYKSVLDYPRGDGYWLWKSLIIQKHLSLIPENDILFYVDVGCSFNINENAKQTFGKYLELIDKHSFLRFQTNHPEYKFTNSTVINYFANKFSIDKSKLECSKQLAATIMAFKNCNVVRDFLSNYLKCLDQDGNLITDVYNTINPHPEFYDHRHDQSLFSLLYKCLGHTFVLEDHTFSSTNWDECSHAPIIATRKRK
jgi:hypothetical protein